MRGLLSFSYRLLPTLTDYHNPELEGLLKAQSLRGRNKGPLISSRYYICNYAFLPSRSFGSRQDGDELRLVQTLISPVVYIGAIAVSSFPEVRGCLQITSPSFSI